MIDYLLENHLPFHRYLDVKDIRKLLIIHRDYSDYISNSEWFHIFKIHFKIKDVKINKNSINIIHNQNHVTSIDNCIRTKPKKLYEYLIQYQNIE
jgi:hypothetical protein